MNIYREGLIKVLPHIKALVIVIGSSIFLYQFASILSPMFAASQISNSSFLLITKNSLQSYGSMLTELLVLLSVLIALYLGISLISGQLNIPQKGALNKNETSIFHDKILIFFLVIAIVTRLSMLVSLSANLDEGIYSMIIPSVNLKNLTPQLETGAPYLRGLPYTYLSAFLNIFLNDPILSGRLISFICGVLIIPQFYKFLLSIHSKEAARFGALMLALFPTLILYSAQARQYSFNMLLYLIVFSTLLSVKKNNFIGFLIPLILLSLSHEFVFLLVPLIMYYMFSTKKWSNGIIFTGIVVTGFMIQYLVFTKITSQTFETYSGGVKQLLSLSISTGSIMNGFIRVLQTLQYFIIVIPASIVLMIKKDSIIKTQRILIIIGQIAVELAIFSFILARNQTRYRLTLVLLLIMITSIILSELIKTSKNKLITTVILLTIFLLSPITLDLPYDTKFPKETVSTTAKLALQQFSQAHGYASIAGEAPISDYKEIESFKDLLTGYTVITTDLYNLSVYQEIDYVYNIQLQTYSSYYEEDSPQIKRNVYYSTPYISTPEVFRLIYTDEKLAFILDNRSYYHIPQEIRDVIVKNFTLHIVSPNEETGVIHRSSDNGLYLFTSE